MSVLHELRRNIRFLKKLRWNKDLVRSLLESENLPFIKYVPPGHFYSPLPDLPQIRAKSNIIFDCSTRDLADININENSQVQLLKFFSNFYDEMQFSDNKLEGQRYFLDNPYFSYGDGIILYSFMRNFKPKRVVEVGSGFSSAEMLDVNDVFMNHEIELTFIEPFPERLFELLSAEDKKRVRIESKPVQEVPPSVFSSLEAHDILFIDSSHVAKIDSDVVHILFNILPKLKKGVIVHFHDVPWPFEYPKRWVEEGRAWNEAYFLRAFLQNNATFEILYFNAFMAFHHGDLLCETMPKVLKTPSSPVTLGNSSLWLRKVH